MLYDPNWKPKDEVVIKRDDLTAAQVKALLRVREALKTGEISRKQFNMDITCDHRQGCGTVGCIGGWMGLFESLDAGLTMDEIFRKDGKISAKAAEYFAPIHGSWSAANIFYNLFYPHPVPGKTRYCFGYKATPKDGIKAIENFLAGEEYPWKDWNGKKTGDVF